MRNTGGDDESVHLVGIVVVIVVIMCASLMGELDQIHHNVLVDLAIYVWFIEPVLGEWLN